MAKEWYEKLDFWDYAAAGLFVLGTIIVITYSSFENLMLIVGTGIIDAVLIGILVARVMSKARR